MNPSIESEYLFEPDRPATLAVEGSNKRYPVRRIFCVGRNYVAHAREMGAEVERDQPFFFCKPASAIVQSGTQIPYPPGTANLHYEMELVVALSGELFEANIQQAKDAIFGFACGLDLTRRDLQSRFKQKSHPWDLAKAFENSAVISALNPSVSIDGLDDQSIELSHNGQLKQQARLGDMVWRVEELLEFLSRYYHLGAGDLIFTGTPAGVGAVESGDTLEGSISGIGTISLGIKND